MSNRLYFLGAGFSKALFPKMPLMKDLSAELENNFKGEIEKLSLESFNDNFEEMISYLYSKYPWKNDADTYSMLGLHMRFMDFLFDSFSILEKEFFDTIIKTESLSPEWNRLFVDFSKFSRPIITLNYDTLLESVIWNYTIRPTPSSTLNKYSACAKMMDYLDFYKLPMMGLYERMGGSFIGGGEFNRKNIQIIKLHGSMNWFHSREVQNPGDSLYYLPDYFNSIESYKFHLAGLRPFIIPPSIDKSSFYFENRFMKIPWEQAKSALNAAEEIIFYGYSLPISDSYLRLLFKSSITTKLTKIVIIDINDSEEFREHINLYFNFASTKIIFYQSLREFLDSENITETDCA